MQFGSGRGEAVFDLVRSQAGPDILNVGTVLWGGRTCVLFV